MDRRLEDEAQRDLDVLMTEAARVVTLGIERWKRGERMRLGEESREASKSPRLRAAIERLRKVGGGEPAREAEVGTLLDDEVKRKIRPVKVALWATEIKCVRDFDREWGRDEILIGAVGHDIYTGRDTMQAPVKLGEFGKADRQKTRNITDVKLAEFPIGPGLWRDSIYLASVYLGERDFGGMKRYMEQSGLSSRQFLQLMTGFYMVSLSSLLGVSITAEGDLDERSLEKGIAAGLGPLMLRYPVRWPLKVARRVLRAAILEAVVGGIRHAIADDMFPPVVLPFHLSVPPGGSLDDLNTRGVTQFRYTQEKRREEVIVQYDISYEWRVATALASDADLLLPKPTEAVAGSAAALANLDKIENVVVVMLENRSFDHMLGFLTADRGRTDFDDGLKRSHSNPLIKKDFDTRVGEGILKKDENIFAGPLADTWLREDPRHFSQAVAQQIFGDILPDVDGIKASEDPHWLTEAELAALRKDTENHKFLPEKMRGFVRDYLVYLSANGNLPHQQEGREYRSSDLVLIRDQLAEVMGYHTAEHLPAYDLLATEFAVCDRWFCSFPGNTWVNRTISLTGKAARQAKPDIPLDASTAGHEDHLLWITGNKMPFDEPSFFRVLDENNYKGKKIDWAFYAQDVPSLLMVDATYASELKNGVQGAPDRLRTIRKFFRDAERGKLPHVSWVDPNFMDVGEMRDNLFGWEADKDTDDYALSHLYDLDQANDDHPPVDVAHGQSFVLAILLALMNSPQWEKTLLIVTYDEHGGFHDHVEPPLNESFDAQPVSLAESPAFLSLGVRVPAMIASAWVDRQLVSHTRFDHTSIIKTILMKFCRKADGSIPHVSARVDHAHHLGGLLNAKQARFSKGGVRSASMTAFAEGLGSVMKVRRQVDAARMAGVKREPNDLQKQLGEGRRALFGRMGKTAASAG